VWVTNDAYFRIFTSLIGITTVDTHLALRAEADADSEILKLTSEQFADLLAGEMLAPRPPRQSTRLKRTVDTAVEDVNTREELEAVSRTSAVSIGMWSKRRNSL
jgi:hypothetical protein